jgi:hypothetical protein
LLVHAEVAAAVSDQFIELFEGAFIEQQLDALAGGEFAFAVLTGAAVVATTQFGGGVTAAEFLELVHSFDCSGRL